MERESSVTEGSKAGDPQLTLSDDELVPSNRVSKLLCAFWALTTPPRWVVTRGSCRPPHIMRHTLRRAMQSVTVNLPRCESCESDQ
jgi:hypothetical protein